MIPVDQQELHTLAGEYVLGVLGPDETRAVEAALETHAALRDAVRFWQEKLHPLSETVPPVPPPAGTWEGIAARLDQRGAQQRPSRWWDRPAPWRWSTAAFAALAAGLALFLMLQPAPRVYVAVLQAPRTTPVNFVASIGRSGFRLRATEGVSPPADHVYELWGRPRGAQTMQPLGVIPADGVLTLATLPNGIGDGATLAISVEPPGGSPTGQPTGPVAFVGALKSL